jgi:hypothetical protein
MSTPTSTPQEKALKRVLLISALDGWSLVAIASLSLLLTLALGELLGIAVSLLVLAAGIVELRGRRALKRRNADGMKLLVRAQLFLLTVILVYCARSLGSFDAGYLKEQLIPEMRQYFLLFGINFDEILQQFELTEDNLVPLVHTAFLVLYGSVALISLIYQGGLALYYRGKTRFVIEALAAPVPPLQ